MLNTDRRAIRFARGKTLRLSRYKTEIRAGVRFGSPASNCRGSGFCEIFSLDGFIRPAACNCKAEVSIKALADDGLEFRFLREKLSKTQQRKYFSDKVFLMEADLELPIFLRQALRLKKRKLPAGIYGIEEEGPYWKITFPVKNTLKPDFRKRLWAGGNQKSNNSPEF